MDYSKLHQIFLKSKGVSTDTREDLSNKIFFALKGPNFNANAFAGQALENGARLVVVDEKSIEDDRILLVENSLSTLQGLANYHRKKHPAKFVGITGSNGKTTTKELLYSVLSEKYRTQATKGNLNNHIGVPLTLLSIKPDCEVAIIEMGANHPKEIEFLSSIAEPEIGLITNIGKAHLEGFGSIEGVDRSKRELFNFIEKAGGQIFLNQNDPFLTAAKDNYTNVISYGKDTVNDYYIEPNSEDLSLNLNMQVGGNLLKVKSALFGKYNADNILAAATVADFLGMGPDDIVAGIEKYQPANSRSQVAKSTRNTIILDAYNANPSSVEKAIEELSKIADKQALAILGEMKEVGADTDLAHAYIADLLNKYQIEHVLIGSAFKQHCNDFCIAHFNDSASALEDANTFEKFKERTILVKGSRSVALEKIVPLL